MENLKESVKQIRIPEEMQTRILQNCVEKIEMDKEKEDMKKNFVNSFKKPVVIAATLAICFCLTGITALAATGKLQGFFKDKTNWNGAITGQTYENATEELEVTANVQEDVLAVTVVMVVPEVAPYRETEKLSIGEYQILDENGAVVVRGEATEAVTRKGTVNMLSIPVEQLANGTYKLIVRSFVSEKKADQALEIKGHWECEFVK